RHIGAAGQSRKCFELVLSLQPGHPLGRWQVVSVLLEEQVAHTDGEDWNACTRHDLHGLIEGDLAESIYTGSDQNHRRMTLHFLQAKVFTGAGIFLIELNCLSAKQGE